MRRLFRALCAATALALPAVPVPAAAQDPGGLGAGLDRGEPVALVADRIDYDSAAREIVASGNVEVYYGERTLTADRIVYSDATRRITATGNLVLRDPTGATLFAEFADLDAELKDGLVRGAMTVLDRYSKLAAVEARRVDDRYNILSRAVYSPCEVCAEEPTPLWRIRARRVIHDQEERVIHYEDARLEVLGVPVLWTPYFSHPDPTVKRATGFITPTLKSSPRNFGYGVKTPFFLVIDDHTDLTFTPFLTTNDGLVGGLELRRAFAAGDLRLGGTVARSDFAGDRDWHGHLDTEGNFRLDNGIRWGWDVKVASDDGYLRYFDFSDEDRLTSEVFMRRYRRDGFFDISSVRFQSLRNNEPAGQIPLVIPDMAARHELTEDLAGGRLGIFMNSQGLLRNNGEDTGRFSIGADWERELILPAGLALKGFAEVRGDMFLVGDAADGDRYGTQFRLAPLAGVEARYPLLATTGGGAAHVIEPVAQAIVAPFGGNGPEIPNEDSLITEFDETSLFDRSHFAGLDGFEEGPRFNLGLRYELLSDTGLSFDTTVGRVLRFADATEFSSGSGLFEAQSDWIAAWSAAYDPYVSITQRLRFDDDLEMTRNETQLALDLDPVRFDVQYVFLETDPFAGALTDREEIFARSRIRLTREWSVNGFLRRDLELGEFVTLGGGVRFANECCSVTALLRRDFTDQDNVRASTSFGIEVELFTLGGSGASFGG